LPCSRSRERGAAELSRAARKRLAWFDYYASHGRNVALTCHHFGVSWQAFQRWKPRYDPEDLTTQDDRSHRAHHRW
ncbi:MAG TPA: helix-turn-helix domain-containing protein, partial [Terriglobia bacterium]|nr:helix-turn-helix domain-containing protein [Terriglobia bacterium]